MVMSNGRKKMRTQMVNANENVRPGIDGQPELLRVRVPNGLANK